MSLLKIAKEAADVVLGLRSYKKFQAESMKAGKKIYEAEDAIKETRFHLESLSSVFGGFGGSQKTPKGQAVEESLKLIREADSLIDQAKKKLRDSQERMRQVDWEKM